MTAPPSQPPLITIRPMQPQDMQQVVAVDQASFSLPWPANAYHYELYDNPLSFLLVAEAQAPDSSSAPSIVGVVVVWLILGEAHIATIAVHPDYRGQGIARKLIAAALKDAIQKESYEATLEVRAQNFIAQKLYLRFGFQIVGRRPRYYRDNNEDALIMTVYKLGPAYLEWLESSAWNTDGAWSAGGIEAAPGMQAAPDTE